MAKMNDDINNVLITGVTGFVGSTLFELLKNHPGIDVSGVCRESQSNSEWVNTGCIEAADLTAVLQGIDVVVHCAARVHVMDDAAADPIEEYSRINVDGTLNLAKQAVAAGVSRFIFISTLKVNGEETKNGRVFSEQDRPEAIDPYGLSKLEAETKLRELAVETGLEVVIIRPPLVYGPGVKGNFASLVKLARKPYPLPFGSIRNQRSMIYVGNLVKFIEICIEHPAAANETFLISDGDDVSLSDLIKHIRINSGQKAKMLPVPPCMFALLGQLTGKAAVMNRLIGNLQLDCTKAEKLLNWVPPYSVAEGIQQTISGYKNKHG